MTHSEGLAPMANDMQLTGPVQLLESGAGPEQYLTFVHRYRAALVAIQQACEAGRVCDDVPWFDRITTLYDFVAEVLTPSPPAALADLFEDTALPAEVTDEAIVERMARAMAERCGWYWDDLPDGTDADDSKGWWLECARAALTAMPADGWSLRVAMERADLNAAAVDAAERAIRG